MGDETSDTDLISQLLHETYSQVKDSDDLILNSQELLDYFGRKEISSWDVFFERENIEHFCLKYDKETKMFFSKMLNKDFYFPSNWSVFISLSEARVQKKNDFVIVNSMIDLDKLAYIFSEYIGRSCSLCLTWSEN